MTEQTPMTNATPIQFLLSRGVQNFLTIAALGRYVTLKSSVFTGFLIALGIYGIIIISLYLGQERLIFFNAIPEEAPLPAVGDLPGLARLILKTEDGESLVAWHVAGQAAKPLILYFHGNGDTLKSRTKRFFELTRDGNPLLAIDYRGYGGSTGVPTEAGLMFDAKAALDAANALGYETHTIILYGESLGTALATRLGAAYPFRAIVLEAPFPSIKALGVHRYWYIPLEFLLKYPFDVSAAIKNLKAPVLVLHGSHDDIIAEKFSHIQYQAAPWPKDWLSVQGGGHLVLMRPDVLDKVRGFLAAQLNNI